MSADRPILTELLDLLEEAEKMPEPSRSVQLLRLKNEHHRQVPYLLTLAKHYREGK